MKQFWRKNYAFIPVSNIRAQRAGEYKDGRQVAALEQRDLS